MKIKVPFKKGILLREKYLDFIFNIGCLEDACNDLGIEFHQMSEVDSYDFSLSVLYNAYRQGCMRRFRRPRYKMAHAIVWNEHMGRESKKLVAEGMTDLMGKLKRSAGSEVKKK